MITSCYRCKGTGRVICPSCNGQGEVKAHWGGLTTCSQCKGTGKVKCFFCSGTGIIDNEKKSEAQKSKEL